MLKSKPSTGNPSIGSDLKRVDAHVIQPGEYDDAPEITSEMLRRADLYEGDKLVRRGRPPLEAPKQAIKLRLDADVVEHFRETGPGWQTRINEALRKALNVRMGLHVSTTGRLAKASRKTGPATSAAEEAAEKEARKERYRKAKKAAAGRRAPAKKRA
jgi:uncharacterized protein (DUF4415 family)